MNLLAMRLLLPLGILFRLAPLAGEARSARRVAIRAPQELALSGRLERWGAVARQRGIELSIGAEEEPVPSGWEALRLSSFPVSGRFRSLLNRFPIRLGKRGFEFDGRAYSSEEEAIALSDPARPGETLILGNSPGAALRLLFSALRSAASRIDYRVFSGFLSKEGRFQRRGTGLSIDRSSDRDEIAEKELFYTSLQTERYLGALWRFHDSEREELGKWQRVFQSFLRGGAAENSVTVVLFPDPARKALYTGSSRPADLRNEGGAIHVDLDVSAPVEPDLISPVLAAAALSAGNPRLLSRPTIALAAGARALGRWWGRDIRAFAAFLHRAEVEPPVEELSSSAVGPAPPFGWAGPLSPIFAVGAAASYLEAGARSEGEAAVDRALSASNGELAAALSRWRRVAIRESSQEPARRPMPRGFLRGISYAMTNSVEASYASPRSRETLHRIQQMSVNSVSVMPYAFSPDPASPEIDFVHRSPSGETDEGTVRAVSDARSLGMTAMVKPQIWLGRGAFVGGIAMRGEEDWRKWFASYRRFIVHHAVVAEAAGAALFCVGTELVGTERQEKAWREVIASVRLATGAPLLYASNWASRAPAVPFWDALDAIGVDFYDPLSSDPQASDGALREGARRAARPLRQLAAKMGKPVIFAEAGYPPVRGAWVEPHEENDGRAYAPRDAARAISAVFRALEKEAWWRGVYWWKVFSRGQSGQPGPRDFNFLGMPAQEEIAKGFRRLAADSGSPF